MRSTLTGNKDLDIDILNKLNDKDLVSFCSTSKYATQLCNDQKLWLRRTISRYGFIPLEIMKEYKGDKSWSEYYIELNVNVKNSNYLLIGSSETGRLDFIILSLNQGANIHITNDLALRRASVRGHLEVVKYLISQGADIHAQYDYPLRFASLNGHLEVVKYLISKGADIHADNDFALRYASLNGYLEVVKYLVSQGADIHADNDFALRWARRNGHTAVVKYLEEQISKEL